MNEGKTRQATIYVGLKDAASKQQRFSTERYVSILKNVCQNYHVAFSMNRIEGSYFHEDGTYVEENTLQITTIDVPDETIKEIARDLCAFFNQESVMVTYSDSEVLFISEDIGL